MVVKTARTSAKAAEGQNATLEFILVNHPLDCPVCDKGGECPLQDLTFRYGPGNTRMNFEKTTFEKPIPISPTISLDRERCILCYRCTRFSSDVSEDGQLVARQPRRDVGDHDVRGRAVHRAPSPATSPSSARSVRCCRRSTASRHGRGRSSTCPTVCGLCPVGCNINATVREGKVKRILSRNHPEIDEGWICDKGRFAFTHLRAEDRLVEPLQRARLHGLEPVSWERGARRGRAAARERARPRRHRRFPARRRSSRRTRSGSCCARASSRTRRCCRRRSPERSTPTGSRSRRSATPTWSSCWATSRSSSARRSSISGSSRAARNGARIVDYATTRPSATPSAIVLVWSGPGGRGGATVAKLAEKLGLAGATAAAPSTSPRRRTAVASPTPGPRAATRRPRPRTRSALLVVSGDEAAGDPNVRALAEQADATIVDLDVRRARRRLGRTSSCPARATSSATARSSTSKAACSACAAPSTPPCPDELEWISQLAARFDVDVAPYAAGVFGEVSERVYGGLSFGEVGERAPLRVYPDAPAQVAREALPAPEQTAKRGEIRLVAYKPLFSGAAVERVTELQFQRPQPEVELSAEDARRRKHRDRRPRHGRLERQRGHAAGPRQPAPAPGDRARRDRARGRPRRGRRAAARPRRSA